MNSIPYHSNNSAMPVWVTIDEAVNVIKKQAGIEITASEVWRYALYGHLTLSIYFQSPVILRRIKVGKNKIFLMKGKDDPVNRLCYLSSEYIFMSNSWRVKTEGDYITPPSYIMDTPLLGYEYVMLQRLLAHSLNLPLPETGQSNTYCGILVSDESHIFQVFEYQSLEQRIFQQLQFIPADKASLCHDEINKIQFDRTRKDYFPVYHFPGDACFVVQRQHLESFLNRFYSSATKPSIQISTPLSRLLWLACKHNEHTNSLLDHPYKLVSVFEEWAASDGITDRLSGDTLKKALQRGSPA